MREKNNFYCVVVIALIVTTSIFGQTIKTWQQSSFNDFLTGNKTDICFTDQINSGLYACLNPTKILNDQPTPKQEIEIVECLGKYYSTFVEGAEVYLQKYTSDKKTDGLPIRINDLSKIAGQNGHSRIYPLPTGKMLLVYTPSGNRIQQYAFDYSIYAQYLVDTIRIGKNFVINEKPNYDNHIPVVVPDTAKNLFYVFLGERDLQNNDSTKIVVFVYDSNGNKLQNKTLLNKDSRAKIERVRQVIRDGFGNFFVSGEYITCNVSYCVDAFVRKFDSNFAPLSPITILNVPNDRVAQAFATACIKNNILFAVWGGEIIKADWSDSQLFGQIFDLSLNRIGSSFQISNDGHNNVRNPLIYRQDSLFCVEWDRWNELARLYEHFITKWLVTGNSRGTYISSIYDTESKAAKLLSIKWHSSQPNQKNILFQIRSAKDKTQIESSRWFGPNSTTDFYTIQSGEKINNIHNENRYVQYKAILNLDQYGSSPILNSVSIDYELDALPNEYNLKQNYPNPFNNSTTIEFNLPVSNHTNLFVYNTLGEKIDALINNQLMRDNYKIAWEPKNLPSGIYFLRLNSGNYSALRKLVYIK